MIDGSIWTSAGMSAGVSGPLSVQALAGAAFLTFAAIQATVQGGNGTVTREGN
jgi:hypothetical protein